MAQSLDIALSTSETASLGERRYVFISHTNGDKTDGVEYFFTCPQGVDDLESATFVAWGSGSDLPIPDFVIDLDADLPLVEVDEPRTTVFKLVLLKRRYGAVDRARIDERARRRVWGRVRRDYRRSGGYDGSLARWRAWMELDYETFWSRGGDAGMREWAAKHPVRVTSLV
jgi:hypothetical protein